MFLLSFSTCEALHHTLRFAKIDSTPENFLKCSYSSAGGLKQVSHSVHLLSGLSLSPSALSPVSLALSAGSSWSIFLFTNLQSQPETDVLRAHYLSCFQKILSLIPKESHSPRSTFANLTTSLKGNI